MPSEAYENVVKLFAAQRGGAGDVEVTVEMMRAGYDALGQAFPLPDGTINTPVVAAGVPAEWVSAYEAPSRRTLLYLHSGGYCIGSPSIFRNVCARLSAGADARVLLLDYRLAPEHPYPAAIDDAVAAYKWLLDEGTPSSSIGIVGASAGGGLTITTLVEARGAGLPMPGAAVAISPWADMTGLGAVDPHSAETDYLTDEAIERFRNWYIGAEGDPADPRVSPVLADLTALPPTMVFAGGMEILFDTARRLTAALSEASVEAELSVAPGMFHDIPTFGGVFPEADEAIATISDFLGLRLS